MNGKHFSRTSPLVAFAAIASISAAYVVQEVREGYKDTPILPRQKWHVHDPARPYPVEVVPGIGSAPPSDATVLLGPDCNLSHWMQTDTGEFDGKPHDAKWNVRDGYIDVAGGTGDMYSREKFGDCQLHIEWQEPEGIEGKGQGRGNSGVYLMSRYEVQVLDSYRSATYADGQAGAIYGQWPPMVNPMRPPGEWQSYDIIFKAPRYSGDRLVEPAYLTLLFNGVLVHEHQRINGPTAHRTILPYAREETEMPIRIQDHRSSRPVRFRNIWVRRLNGYDQPEHRSPD